MKGVVVGRLALVLAVVSGAGAASEVRAVQQRAAPDPAYGCIVCHADKRRAFRQGVHSEAGIRCHDCHGGDTRAYETGPAHRGRFIGSPNKLETIRLCSACHSDPDQLRQYGLSADQLAAFRTSRHGQLLLGQGNTDAPTCTDCHDAHTILPPEDARSSVHPTNIPATCARCHDDERLMASYGLPTDQLQRYRDGAHGIAVFEQQNFAAPTCVGCHGSHAALPPRVSEIAHVCGKCHVLLARAFYNGPHGRPSLDGRFDGCVACHSNHGTEPIPPAAIAELCTSCHDPESRAVLLGGEIQEQVLRAEEDLAAAARAIDDMVRIGRRTADERFRYAAALTEFRQLAQVQHSLDADHLERLGLRVRSNTDVIRRTAEAYAEERWEHKLLLVPVWFLALSAIVFTWFKLRELGR